MRVRVREGRDEGNVVVDPLRPHPRLQEPLFRFLTLRVVLGAMLAEIVLLRETCNCRPSALLLYSPATTPAASWSNTARLTPRPVAVESCRRSPSDSLVNIVARSLTRRYSGSCL